MSILLAMVFAAVVRFADPPKANHPQTWFHMIGGNVSKEGLTADLEALAQAGVSGIQLFHGQVGEASAWPRTGRQIPCLSENWEEVIRFAADECRRLDLKFEMQNCPGWSMSGGPWITPDKAMRRLVAFRAGERPNFSPDDDYREIGVVRFPAPVGWNVPDPVPTASDRQGDVTVYSFGEPVTIRMLELPSPNAFEPAWGYEPCLRVRFEAEVGGQWNPVLDRDYPRGCWQDGSPVSFACGETVARRWRLSFSGPHPRRPPTFVRFRSTARIDNWEALAGWCFRELPSAVRRPVPADGWAELVFGHVNAKRKNGPAPLEATGWECDKLDPKGVRTNFEGYLGKLLRGPLAGGRLQGVVVDSWECGRQTWTVRMEEYFRDMNGYELRPHLPTVFGYPVGDAASDGRFLRDWRRTLSRLVEENYYRPMSELCREKGLALQFETAFQDVLPGDPLRYWKYADIPMCEFWQPHDNAVGFVGSDNFKPVRPCVSAAHLYGKPRVQAEAFTSMDLDWNEDFKVLKAAADHHYARGVTHLVLHTYTHNPQVGDAFVAPGTSFGCGIGTPFVRGQTWWRFMPHLTDYLARCGMMLERGHPVVDVLWMLGDDHQYRPDENAAFPDDYKYDYLNSDALLTRLSVRNGRFVLPDGMSYRVIWIPDGTFLLPETETKLAELSARGGRIVRGKLNPDWPSPLARLGLKPKAWYQRHDDGEDIFFVVQENGETRFVCLKDGRRQVLDPVTGGECPDWRMDGRSPVRTLRVQAKAATDYPAWATEREYVCRLTVEDAVAHPTVLSLGKVCDWAEVFVNGCPVATLWCEPYVCDVAPAVRTGDNEIRIKVTSTWYNRLVRDAGLPEGERGTWTMAGPRAGSGFRDAGLCGPVELRFF